MAPDTQEDNHLEQYIQGEHQNEDHQRLQAFYQACKEQGLSKVQKLYKKEDIQAKICIQENEIG